MSFPSDISEHIKEHFRDPNRVYKILDNLVVNKEELRIIRSILMLSDSDYDSVKAWVKSANEDYRNVIFYAEYDNRNIRKFDYNNPINKQVAYAYKE